MNKNRKKRYQFMQLYRYIYIDIGIVMLYTWELTMHALSLNPQFFRNIW